MLCDICKQKKARIFYTEVINGEKHEQHLCEDCASVYQGFASKETKIPGLSFGNMLSGILANYAKGLEEIKYSQKACARCGMTEQEFLAKGRFGCAQCYETFADVLENNLKVIQGAETHVGKVPVNCVGEERRSEGVEPEAGAPAEKAETKKRVRKTAADRAEDKAAGKKAVKTADKKKTAAEPAKTGTARGRKKVSAEEAREIKKKEIKAKLDNAIKDEDYELAAKLRDEIRALDKVPLGKKQEESGRAVKAK